MSNYTEDDDDDTVPRIGRPRGTRYPEPEPCPFCGGEGVIYGKFGYEMCPHCDGEGEIW